MIRKITANQIEHLKIAAKQESIGFAKRSEYYAHFDEDGITGFCAVIRYANKIVLKSSYVIPEKRGRGIYRKMLEYRLKKYSHLRIEAGCTPMSLGALLRRGFKVVSHAKNGCIKVVKIPKKEETK